MRKFVFILIGLIWLTGLIGNPVFALSVGSGDSDGNLVVNANDIKTTIGKYVKAVTTLTDQYTDGKINIFDVIVSVRRLPMTGAVDFYVSPSGNDANAGTLAAPFKTLTKARDRVRTINTNMTKDINVYLRGGTYALTAPLTFTGVDSGTNGFKITYQAYQSEIPIISGGKTITGWVQQGAIWKANVGTNLATRQLFVNGTRAVRARSAGVLPGAVRTGTGYTTTDLTMQNWGNVSDIEFVTFNPTVGDGSEWIQWRCGISSISGGAIVMKQPCFENAVGWTPSGNAPNIPQWIENAYELLDSPGEWYFDKPAGFMYYYPKSGETIATTNVVAPILEILVQGNGAIDQKLRSIEFHGITFSYNTWLEPSSNKGYPHRQATKYIGSIDPVAKRILTDVITPGAINFTHGENIKFERCTFNHLGSSGVNFWTGSKSNVINNSVFTDISATAISLSGPILPSEDSRSITSGNQFTNNLIYDVAVEFQGNDGIWLDWANNTLIAHNEIHDVPYTGIALESRTGNWPVVIIPTNSYDNKVQNNLIYNYLKVLNDGGGVYVNGSQPGTQLSKNVIHTQFGSYTGIYLDGGSQYIEVDNNVVFPFMNPQIVSIFIHRSGDHNIHDNWIQTWIGSLNLNSTYGPSTIVNNHSIGSMSQVPQDIINNAGRQ